jgi:hypothetical protein
MNLETKFYRHDKKLDSGRTNFIATINLIWQNQFYGTINGIWQTNFIATIKMQILDFANLCDWGLASQKQSFKTYRISFFSE